MSDLKDTKYVVFKMNEFGDWFDSIHDQDQDTAPQHLNDAVVIRTQDAFASSALYVYAHSIALVAGVLRTLDIQGKANELQAVADYFSMRAEEASDSVGKMPD